jgi:uncharacterized membrane protein
VALLVMGVLLFASVHFIPSLAPSIKANVRTKIGEDAYKDIFSLLLLSTFVFIIMGWRSAVPEPIYLPFCALHKIALVLVACAFLTMGTSARNSRIRLLIRHPILKKWCVSRTLKKGTQNSDSARCKSIADRPRLDLGPTALDYCAYN